MKEQIHENPKIVAAAERQMQAWAYAKQQAERNVTLHGPHRMHSKLGPYITMSREVGAGAEEVAQRVAEHLGWQVMDKNVLDEIAHRFQISRSMLELVDETTSSWAFDILGAWVDRKIIPHEKYLVRLARVLFTAARHGKVVFVGRGAHFLLPRDHALHVRIIADEKYRLRRTMGELGLTESEARQHLQKLERGRREFIQHFFHHDPDDPHLYDLVLRADLLGVELTADLIVAAHQRMSARG